MAVQQRRKTRSKRDMRRSNNQSISAAALSIDPETGETHRRHHVTESGYYKGRQVINTAPDVAEEEE